MSSLAVWVMSACALVAPRQTIHVPADHPTIQLAIDAAVDGDVIVVAPGTYPELIDFSGKAIVVESSGGAAATFIDGAGLGQSVVTFQSGETSSSVLRGMGVRNGVGTLHGAHRVGGGVFILDSSPLLEGNLFLDNFAGDYGGGVYAEESTVVLRQNCLVDNEAGREGAGAYFLRSSPTVDQNEFVGNLAYSQGGGLAAIGDDVRDDVLCVHDCRFEDNLSADGAGMFASDVVCDVVGNEFEGNWADDGSGGAITGVDVSGSILLNRLEDNPTYYLAALTIWGDSPVVVERNTLHNHADSLAYYAFGTDPRGPTFVGNVATETRQGVWCSGGTPTVLDNRLYGSSGPFDSEAGIYLEYLPLNSTGVIEGNDVSGFETGLFAAFCRGALIRRNRFEDSGQNGVDLFESSATFVDNVICGSSFPAFSSYDSSPTLLRMTITGGNSSTQGAGIFITGPNVPRVESSIIWGNTAPANPSIYDPTGTMVVEWSDVEGGYAGIGNLDVDPAFVSGTDLRLSAGSPCIDAANPADDPCIESDLRRTPRCLDGDLDRLRRVDMGALEFTHADFDVQGSFVPGGTITLDLQGTAGLRALLFAGIQPDAACDGRYGGLFVSLNGGLLLPWGTIPSTVNATLPAGIPGPYDLYLQVLAIDGASKAGSTSNLVVVEVR